MSATDEVLAAFQPDDLRELGIAAVAATIDQHDLESVGRELVVRIVAHGYVLSSDTLRDDAMRLLTAWSVLIPGQAAPSLASASEWCSRVGVADAIRAAAITAGRQAFRPLGNPVGFWVGICLGIERERTR